MERVLYTIQNEQKTTLWNTRNGGTVNNYVSVMTDDGSQLKHLINIFFQIIIYKHILDLTAHILQME